MESAFKVCVGTGADRTVAKVTKKSIITIASEMKDIWTNAAMVLSDCDNLILLYLCPLFNSGSFYAE